MIFQPSARVDLGLDDAFSFSITRLGKWLGTENRDEKEKELGKNYDL